MASLSLVQKLGLLAKLVPLPLVIIYAALTAPFRKALRKKKFSRVLVESAIRYLANVATVPQLQWSNPGLESVYRKWAKQANVEPVVEQVPETGKKLVWIGDKNAEKVVFYVHGGGFMLPIADQMLAFCVHVQQKLGDRVAFVLMEYSLWPLKFPTQLNESVCALAYVLKSHNVTHLGGDSAGANLTLQLLSHTLHPVPDIPISPLSNSKQIPGVLLISPWVSVNERTPTHVRNDASDCLTANTLVAWGEQYISDKQHSYVKVLTAPDGWFNGLDKVTKRVLVTAGDAECLLGDSIQLVERFKKEAGIDVQLDVEEGGVHEDPILEFAAGKQLTGVGEMIVGWLKETV